MRGLLLGLVLCVVSTANAANVVAPDRFESLSAISGQWQLRSESGRDMHIVYAPTARGSVLVETWQGGTSGETLSVFHRHGDRVMATHYCGQGNQPRLILKDGDDKDFVFEFLDATNLTDPDASHLVRLRFTMNEDGSLDRIETYRGSGEEETTRLHLRRVVRSTVAASPNL